MADGTRFKIISTGLLAMALLVAASAGIAYATIPDASSQYHACVLTAMGQVRIIDHDAGANCKENEQHVHWNQSGPSGAAGPQGEPGSEGPPGTPGSATFSARINPGLTGTQFGAVEGVSSGTASVTGSETLSPAATLTARNLSVTRTGSAVVTVTLFVNGGSTALTCNTTSIEATCSNTAASVTIPPGSRLALQIEASGFFGPVLVGFQG